MWALLSYSLLPRGREAGLSDGEFGGGDREGICGSATPACFGPAACREDALVFSLCRAMTLEYALYCGWCRPLFIAAYDWVGKSD